MWFLCRFARAIDVMERPGIPMMLVVYGTMVTSGQTQAVCAFTGPHATDHTGS